MKSGIIPGHAVHVRKRTINHATLENQTITPKCLRNWHDIAFRLKGLCVFLFRCSVIIEIYSCLLRLPSRRKCCRLLFLKTQDMTNARAESESC